MENKGLHTSHFFKIPDEVVLKGLQRDLIWVEFPQHGHPKIMILSSINPPKICSFRCTP